MNENSINATKQTGNKKYEQVKKCRKEKENKRDEIQKTFT